MTTVTMMTFVTPGSFDSSMFKNKMEKKAVLVQTFCKLVFCLLKLASEIISNSKNMKGFSLHLTYFIRDTKRKHLFF